MSGESNAETQRPSARSTRNPRASNLNDEHNNPCLKVLNFLFFLRTKGNILIIRNTGWLPPVLLIVVERKKNAANILEIIALV